jgi:hypothetical protein
MELRSMWLFGDKFLDFIVKNRLKDFSMRFSLNYEGISDSLSVFLHFFYFP